MTHTLWAQRALALLEQGGEPVQTLQDAQRQALAAGHTFCKVDGPYRELDDFLDEVHELNEAIRGGENKAHIRNELGDVLFALVNISRREQIDLYQALHTVALRWLRRKALQEQKIAQAGYTWSTVPSALNDAIWNEVKAELKEIEYR